MVKLILFSKINYIYLILLFLIYKAGIITNKHRCVCVCVCENLKLFLIVYRWAPLSVISNLTREGNGTPLQHSCLENPMDRGAWWAAVHGVAKSQTRPSDFTFTFPFHELERKWQPTPVFLPGESQGRGSLLGCHLWGRTESDTTEAT